MILEAIFFFLFVVVGVALVFLYLKIKTIQDNINHMELQLKSKIGSIIREINNSNLAEYKVDMEQNSAIKQLSYKQM